MPITITCQCGTSYTLKDEFAGQLVKCPQCGRSTQVPAKVAARPQADPAFDRDIFLLRQKAIAISEKYYVWDEQGQTLLFVERPAFLARNLLAALGAFVAGALAFALFAVLAVAMPEDSDAGVALMFIGVLAFLAVAIIVGMVLSPKRHVTFYRDDSKREPVLEVLQDSKYQIVTHTYTVRDPRGVPLAQFAKNWLWNLIRKRWYVYGQDTTLMAMAKEDSVILSLLRRLLGTFYGLLRTNFIILRGDSDDVVGEFKRKFTILDRYVLDMKADPQRTFDRRIALALGVMLDTGERR